MNEELYILVNSDYIQYDASNEKIFFQAIKYALKNKLTQHIDVIFNSAHMKYSASENLWHKIDKAGIEAKDSYTRSLFRMKEYVNNFETEEIEKLCIHLDRNEKTVFYKLLDLIKFVPAPDGYINSFFSIINEMDDKAEIIYSINTPYYQGKTAVDYLIDILNDVNNIYEVDTKTQLEILYHFRSLGAVVTQDLAVCSNDLLLIIEPNTPPDSINGNIDKTYPILEKLLDSATLSETQINILISDFKTVYNKLLKDMEAQWGQDVNNAYEVIDELCLMVDVTDRLYNNNGNIVHMNFKKVLGHILHLAQNEDDINYNLVSALAGLNKCDLSKMMYLLATVQKTFTRSGIEEALANDDLINTVYKNTLKDINDADGIEYLNAIQWYYSKINVRDQGYNFEAISKIDSFFLKNFAKELGPDIFISNDSLKSYLESDVIAPLAQKLRLDRKAIQPENDNKLESSIYEWQNYLNIAVANDIVNYINEHPNNLVGLDVYCNEHFGFGEIYMKTEYLPLIASLSPEALEVLNQVINNETAIKYLSGEVNTDDLLF